MVSASPLRFLAPIALVVFFVAAVIVFSSSEPSPKPPEVTTTSTPANVPRTYRVREGDILTAIANRFRVQVEDIVALNPGLDPQALPVGRRIKLRP